MDPTRTIAKAITVPEPLFQQVEARAREDSEDPAAVIVRYITGYANGDPTPQLVVVFDIDRHAAVPDSEADRYDQQRKIPARRPSFRVNADVWRAAMDRADREGTALSPIITRYLRGYADNII